MKTVKIFNDDLNLFLPHGIMLNIFTYSETFRRKAILRRRINHGCCPMILNLLRTPESGRVEKSRFYEFYYFIYLGCGRLSLTIQKKVCDYNLRKEIIDQEIRSIKSYGSYLFICKTPKN